MQTNLIKRFLATAATMATLGAAVPSMAKPATSSQKAAQTASVDAHAQDRADFLKNYTDLLASQVGELLKQGTLPPMRSLLRSHVLHLDPHYGARQPQTRDRPQGRWRNETHTHPGCLDHGNLT